MSTQSDRKRLDLQRGQRSPGQAMVEFALVLILFLGMVVAIFEGARLIISYVAIGNAVREAGRAGAYLPSAARTASQIDGIMQDKMRQTLGDWLALGPSNLSICRHTNPMHPIDFSVCDQAAPPLVRGSVMDVQITYTFEFMPFEAGFLSHAAIPLTSYYRIPLE